MGGVKFRPLFDLFGPFSIRTTMYFNLSQSTFIVSKQLRLPWRAHVGSARANFRPQGANPRIKRRQGLTLGRKMTNGIQGATGALRNRSGHKNTQFSFMRRGLPDQEAHS